MKKIMISGSMSMSEKMKSVAKALTEMGFTVVVPRDIDWENIPQAEIKARKKELSMEYFREIAGGDTCAVLVVNDKKGEIENYIGASAFAELALAFYFGKRIYVLNEMYGLSRYNR